MATAIIHIYSLIPDSLHAHPTHNPLAAFGAMLCWGIGDFLIQRSTRKIGNLESLAFISIVGALALFPLVMQDLPLFFTAENMVLLAFIGIVSFFVALLDFEALKQGKLSVVEIILEIELPITAVLGFLFFREMLSPMQLGIIGLLFIGVVMISVDSLSFKNPFRKLEKGVMLAAITAVGMAAVNFLTAFGSREVSPIMVIWIPWVVVGCVSLYLIGKREGFGKLFHNGIRFEGLIIWMGLIDTLAWLFYATAVARGNLAITTAITDSYPAIALGLGVLANKEKVASHQYAGAAIALAASVGLAFVA